MNSDVDDSRFAWDPHSLGIYRLANSYSGPPTVSFGDEEQLNIEVTSLIWFPVKFEDAALQSKLKRAEETGNGGSPVRLN